MSNGTHKGIKFVGKWQLNHPKKMLESRSEDALVLLVKLVKSTIDTVETVSTDCLDCCDCWNC